MKVCFCIPPSGVRLNWPFKPLYWAEANTFEAMTCESWIFQVFCGRIWSHVVACGCVAPAPRPNTSLSLRMYQPSTEFEGKGCALILVLRSQSVVLLETPPAVIRLIWSRP